MNKKSACFLLLAAAFVLMWPALYNRGPFFFGDTPSYVRGADAAVYKFTHHATGWTSQQPSAANSKHGDASYEGSADQILSTSKHRSLEDAASHGIFLGRSIYYGLFLYLGYITSSFWLNAYLQALLVAVCLFMLLKHLDLPGQKPFLLVSLFAAMATCSAFISSLLMPDIMVGLAMIALAVLATTQLALARWELCFWALVLCAAQLAHDSSFLITLVFACLFFVVTWNQRTRVKWLRLCILAGTLVVGFLGQTFLKFEIKRATGTEPFHLPYLTARLIDDGSGTAYLRATCPQSGFVVCNYVSQLPKNSDVFLYATNDQGGIFLQASAETRHALAAEQLRLLLAVFRYSPSALLKEFAINTARELTIYDLDVYNLSSGGRYIADMMFPADIRTKIDRTKSYKNQVPAKGFAAYFDVVLCLCLLYLGYMLLRRWRRGPSRTDRVFLVTAWASLAIFLNALICGCLSGVYGRYTTRVIWVIPVMAFVTWMKRRDRTEYNMTTSA